MDVDGFMRIEIEKLKVTIFPFEDCIYDNHIGYGSAMNVYKGTCRVKNQVLNVAFKEHRGFNTGRLLRQKVAELIVDELRKEIKRMEKLRNRSNIIQIYGVTFKNKKPVLIVELADETLDDYLTTRFNNKNPVSWLDKTKLCLDVLSGVREIHKAGIIHGDLKGPNILVLIGKAGELSAKISDFGYSLSISSLQGNIGGTENFSAPEKYSPKLSQWKDKPQQDIYGLGMVVFQIATDGLKEPHENPEDTDKILATLLGQLPLETPKEYQEIIEATIQFLPDKRASLGAVETLLEFRQICELKKRFESHGANIISFESCTLNLNNDELIGSGSSMNVYKGSYRIDNKELPVAFKQHRSWTGRRIPPTGLEDIILQFINEIKLMKNLKKNSNIVQYHGVTFLNAVPFLIVELADERLDNYLSDKYDKYQAVDWFNKAKLCKDVLNGIRELHESNIIHGDLKASNVLVFVKNEIPIAKLSDFGNSALMDSSQSTNGETLYFAAPEKLAQNYAMLSEWRRRKEQDIYGFGMVTFQIVTNGLMRPYENLNDALGAKATDTTSAILLGQLPPDTPEKYRDIIEATAQFLPENRASLESVEALLHELTQEYASKRVEYKEPTIDDPKIKAAARALLSAYRNSEGAKIFKNGRNVSNAELEESLFLAAGLGHVNVIKLLVKDYSAKLDIKNNSKGLTLIHTAARNGHIDIIKMLVNDYHTDVNVKNNKGANAMHYAAKHGHIEIIRMLVKEFNMKIGDKDIFGRMPIHYAAKNGRAKVVEFLADTKDAVNNDRWAALHFAARYGHIDVIKVLTSMRADVSIKEESGRTAIYLAARLGDVNMIQLLVNSGADINSITLDGLTPLHSASYHGRLEAVKLLINLDAEKNIKVWRGIHKGCTPLDIAFKCSHNKVIEVLKNTGGRRGGDIKEESVDDDTGNIAKELLSIYANNEEALFRAAELGRSNVIKILVNEYFVDVNTKDNSKGLMAIHFAARNGHTETVKMLIKEFGMDKDAKNNKGTNAMHYAAKNGHTNVIKMLVQDFGMDVNEKDNLGQTAIHYAAKYGKIDVIQFLTSEPSTVKSAKNDWTLLHYAARYGHISVIRALENVSKADLDSRDSFGRTAIYLAANQGYGNIIRELADLKADVNLPNQDGWTPLHVSSFYGKLEAVKVLIELKAKNYQVSKGDKKGYTPLDMAILHNHSEVATAIKEAGGKSGKHLKLLLWRPR